MAERTAIEVTVDDQGEVTVHVRNVTDAIRRAALEAVTRALGVTPAVEAVADAEWRRAWDAELAQRAAKIDSGAARWLTLDEARARLRAAAERTG